MKILVQMRRLRFVAFLLAFTTGTSTAHPEEYDIVVYGATSGGVTAAVQSAQLGKKVALISPAPRIGGLSSAGLGWTDLGNIAILGGLSRDFYHRVYLHYAAQPNWSQVRDMRGQGTAAFNHTFQTGSIFEPKVAEQVFHDMLSENGVPLFFARLDLDDGVFMDGRRITGIRMEEGKIFRGRMFIDASYEGDVMAQAGVTYTMGRESNDTHGETISGVRSNASGHQVVNGVSAYVIPGDPESGLLPGLENGLEPNGTGDHRFQAYCFRMCLTNVAANRVPIAQPEGYDEKDFELVLRAVEAGQRAFFKLDSMPNGKTDSNNQNGVSCDYIGRNYGPDWNWATLNHHQRDALAKEHEYWQRGMVWTLQNHPRVKAEVGADGLYSTWGLPADEFQDTGHWPYQLYVREARRMVSDYVMTEKNCRRQLVAPDSVGMGAYTMDSHHVQRYVSNGMVRNEGDVQVGIPGPYPISYRSIVPKAGECENLLVPWCLSASHMAFGSIRMEPVFMALGQSSATAAAIALDDHISVQQVPYDKLSMKLRADGQSLTLGNASTFDEAIVVDNEDAAVTGEWVASTSISPYHGSGYLSNDRTGLGEKSVLYTPLLDEAGTYEVQILSTTHSNRATAVPITITHRDGISNRTLNQRTTGNAWTSLGTYDFDAGSSGSVLLGTAGTTDGYVVADAVRWIRIDNTARAIVDVATYIPEIVRGSPVAGSFVFSRNGDITDPLVVHFARGGTAGPAGISPVLPVSVTIPSGQREATVTWVAPKEALPQGPSTVSVTLTADPSYHLGDMTEAVVTLVDEPFDAWRHARFSAAQLADPGISGPNADPDGNGIPNLMEFFSGGSTQPASLVNRDGRLYLQVHRHRAARDLRMTVWESPDLSAWTPVPDLPVPSFLENAGDFQNIGLPLRPAATAGEDKMFFRLRIEQ